VANWAPASPAGAHNYVKKERFMLNSPVFTLRHAAAGLALALIAPLALSAESAVPAAPPAPTVERSLPTVGYGAGTISRADLKGTDLALNAGGSVGISSKQGTVRLSISVKDLPEAAGFGPQYLSYVVWAVTADGQPKNLGEIPVTKGKGKLDLSTSLQTFGLAVTAEPYFAVAVPSELVVLENSLDGTTAAKTPLPEVRFKAFSRKIYPEEGAKPADPEEKVPPDLVQARNAVRIAKAFGAEKYAADSFARARQALTQAEAYIQDRKLRKTVVPKSREAVQSAEAARSQAVQKIEEERVAAENAHVAAQAEEARLAAEKAQAESVAARQEAETAQAEAGAAHARAAQAEATAAEETRRREAAEEEKHALREKLLRQLNLILETRDSARGLIVNMGDVLFDVDKFTLRPEAREKLAKLSGVVLGNAGLKLAVEGHTDSTGGDEHNQKLSESRAGAVRDYLISQNVPAEAITAAGFGKTRPVATNDTAEGRRKNRRVEIVVSGDIIGTEATP
jgi:outer membrane protein OmpA-like peptidoglycan-associated protein